MDVATSPSGSTEVGVRELKNNLSKYLDRVGRGERLVVTERGRPVARIGPIDSDTDRLADLIASGAVRAPKRGLRHRPATRLDAAAPVSDLVTEQRR